MKHLRKTTSTLVVLVTTALSPQLSAEPRIEDLLSADTGLVLLVDDMPELVQKWSENPVAEVWNHDRVRPVMATARRVLQAEHWDGLMKMRLGISLKEFLSELHGQAALTVPDLTAGLGEATGFGIFARVEEPHRFREVMEFVAEFAAQRAPEGVQYSSVDQEFFGEVLHIQQIIRDKEVSYGLGWSMVDGFAIVARPKAYLEELVASVKQGEAEAPWSRSDAYQRLRTWAPAPDLLIYVDGAGLRPLVKGYLGIDEAAEPSAPGGEPQPFTYGTFIRQLVDAFQVENLDGLYLAGSLGVDMTALEANQLYHDNEG